MSMSNEKRAARYTRWKELGVERVRADLLQGGHQLVGGSPEVREEAWSWVKAQESHVIPAR